jgi:hypothetical protein
MFLKLRAGGERAAMQCAAALWYVEMFPASDAARRRTLKMKNNLVVIGLMPEVISLESGEEVVWCCSTASLRIEFDPTRCPFSSNVFQTPAGVQISSGPLRPGTKPSSYRYRVSLNDAAIGHGEVWVRDRS